MRNRNTFFLIILLIMGLSVFLGTKPLPAADPSPVKTTAPLESPEDVETSSPEASPFDVEEPQVSPSESVSPAPLFEPSKTQAPPVTPAPSGTPDLWPEKPRYSVEEAGERQRNQKALGERISRFVQESAAWRNGKVGIYVAKLDNGDVIYNKNGNTPLVPASNLKVVTTATALSYLGPDFKFKTSVWGNSADKATGVMDGNIYLRGTGDPTFMEPFANDPTETFQKMAKVLKKRGIKTIRGDLVGDDSAFDREFLGRGWKTRYLLYDYAAPAGALSINANCISLVIDNSSIKTEPANGYIRPIRKNNGSGKALYVTRKLGTDEIYVYGDSAGKTYRNLTVNNPSKLTVYAFARILKENGINVAGKVRLIDETDKDYTAKNHEICYHLSPPLHRIVREINKESDNVCAQHVFKAIGYYVKGKGSTDNCNEAVREFMKNGGIDPSGLRMADGSGLSEYNRVTPHQLCNILTYMYYHPNKKYFYNSLPVAGKDGTLKYRMAGTEVRAKTGTIQGHVALSGYVVTQAGQTLVFSIMTNYTPSSSGTIRWNEDQLVRLIAECGLTL